MTREYDLAELLKGNVDSIIAKLDELAPVELMTLLQMEKAAEKPRVTVTGAVGHELEQRDKQAQAEQAKAIEDARADERAKAAAEIEALKKRVDALEDEDAEAAALAEDLPACELIEADPEADVPAKVVFTGTDGRTLAALPMLTFGEGAFECRPTGFVLNRKIELPQFGDRTTLAAVWAVDADNRPVGAARLMKPLQFGGGIRAELSSGSLLFGMDAVKAAG